MTMVHSEQCPLFFLSFSFFFILSFLFAFFFLWSFSFLSVLSLSTGFGPLFFFFVFHFVCLHVFSLVFLLWSVVQGGWYNWRWSWCSWLAGQCFPFFFFVFPSFILWYSFLGSYFFSVFLFPCVCLFSLSPLVPPIVFPPKPCGLSLAFIKSENAMRSYLKIIRQPYRTVGNGILRCIWRLGGSWQRRGPWFDIVSVESVEWRWWIVYDTFFQLIWLISICSLKFLHLATGPLFMDFF